MTVLIAFDGSNNARAAIKYAARHVDPQPTVILSVWEQVVTQLRWAPIAVAGPTVMRTDGDEMAAQERHAQQIAARGAELAAEAGIARVTTRRECCAGPIWAAIVDVADELDASLIVMGSRGLSGARSVLLGSVTTRVLHHAHRPMLIVPPPRRDRDRGYGGDRGNGGDRGDGATKG